MPGSRQDYLLGMIKQTFAMLRRLRELLDEGGAPEEIARQARAAAAELLGAQAPLLERLDPASAARLVGDSERVGAWAELLLVEAEARRRLGDDGAAQALELRATALRAAAPGAA